MKLTFFLTSVDELATVRSVRDEHVDSARPPASSLVQVAGLFRPDLLVEVEATAWLPSAFGSRRVEAGGFGVGARG